MSYYKKLFILLVAVALCSCHNETSKQELTESRHIAVADGTYQSSHFEGSTRSIEETKADSIITIIKTDTVTITQKIYSPGKVIARTDTVAKKDTIATVNTIYVRDTLWQKSEESTGKQQSFLGEFKGVVIALSVLVIAVAGAFIVFKIARAGKL